MFSNLASYIFGGSSEANNEEAAFNDKAKVEVKANPNVGEDEWEIVGGDVQPSLTLGSLNDVTARPTTGSTGSSEAPSEMEEDEDLVVIPEEPSSNLQEAAGMPTREIALTRSARRLTSPLACPNGISLSQMKALRSSQKLKQKEGSKLMTSKASERQNKAVKIRSNQSNTKRNKAANLTIKSAGFNKQLKQC